jgi:HEAT repeat protein
VQGSDDRINHLSANQDVHADSNTISLLIAKLSAKDGREREKARWSLVAIGSPAVADLIELLEAASEQVRWEAAKALADIADPAAADALVKALEDKVFDVRWLAAKGLINLGREGLVPLLQALIERSDSPWLRDAAHHVLHDLAVGELEELLEPIMDSLEDAEAAIETPLIAKAILDRLVSGQPENR